MILFIDSCTNKVSADKFHVNIFCAQVNSSVDRCQLSVFHWLAGSSKVILCVREKGENVQRQNFGTN